MRIRNEEWLHLAKGTAIGSQRRVRHGNERTEAMTVGNREDRWWCYCQRCKAGAVEMKSHVMVGMNAPPESTSLVHPTDGCAIASLPAHETQHLTAFLASKHMDWMFFEGTPVTWSRSRQRLLVHTLSGLMGRDTTERSAQKWLTYDRQHYIAAQVTSANAVLVEDCFSLLKVQYAINAARLDCAVICTLGTAIHDSLFLWLLKNAARVWSFYDGDPAGWKGALANARRLQAAGLYGGGSSAISECAPRDMDPKDMQLGNIAQHVKGLLTIS